eukprot:CAMPEP_0194535250 /NCGR_PEP_ID=MMETSP0253-20130528/73727_1 /TAXON_ID=2966 /ORGANISM="Noctiluca scintillans" /LENGTH=366 /DNA_ID=CAMNT_0039381001 /DNA_START=46 /DNA_END=1146 /DNA_ORIENTATION=-
MSFSVRCWTRCDSLRKFIRCWSSRADVRIITYNVLNPLLCNPDRFPRCDPQHLEEDVRWHRVWSKLAGELESTRPAVICLQEVNESWAARLHTHFQKRGWYFAYSLTPHTKFLPMGVAIAWNHDLELEELIFRPPSAEVMLPQISDSWGKWLLRRLTGSRFGRGSAARLPWAHASSVMNRFIAARFGDRTRGKSFVVATYHMPCLFGADVQRKAKAIHCAIFRNAVDRFAGDLDFVLAADFNTKPSDAELLVVQDGVLMDEIRPESFEGLSLERWLDKSRKLRSAYFDVLGREPAFTNNAWMDGFGEPFQETIDYIFVSDGFSVDAVRPLPEEGDVSYPTAVEPSDHVLLAADLTLSGGEHRPLST